MKQGKFFNVTRIILEYEIVRCWEVTDAYFGFIIEGVEEIGTLDEFRERRSDFEISEDERRRSKIGNLKKKAINASTKFTHSLKKRGKRKIDYRIPSVAIEDVRDEKEESVVLEFRRKLLERDLLPPRHDEYHTLLRFVCPSLAAT